MVDRILLALWAAWLTPPERHTIKPRRVWYVVVPVLSFEVALTLKIVGFMAPLPVQWQWP